MPVSCRRSAVSFGVDLDSERPLGGINDLSRPTLGHHVMGAELVAVTSDDIRQ